MMEDRHSREHEYILQTRRKPEEIAALNGASMRGARTLARRAKHVWGGIEAELGRKMQHFWKSCWETAHIYVYNQDDRKPALCSL